MKTTLLLLLCMVWAVGAQDTAPSPEPTATDAPPVEPAAPAVPTEPAPTPSAAPPENPSSTPPAPAAPPRRVPSSHGDRTGKPWTGQRVVSDLHAGWGWVKPEGAPWSAAKWVMLQEEPGIRMAPGRFLRHPNHDNGMQYRLFGRMMDYKAYEPAVDAYVNVFRIEGFEVVGPGEPLKLKPPIGGKKNERFSPRGLRMD